MEHVNIVLRQYFRPLVRYVKTLYVDFALSRRLAYDFCVIVFIRIYIFVMCFVFVTRLISLGFRLTTSHASLCLEAGRTTTRAYNLAFFPGITILKRDF